MPVFDPAVVMLSQSSALPETVVITVGDLKITAAEVEKIVASMPPQNRQYFASPAGRTQFAEFLIKTKLFVREAEKAGIGGHVSALAGAAVAGAILVGMGRHRILALTSLGAAIVNLGSFPYEDPNYHDLGDTPDKVDMANVHMAARAILAAVLMTDRDGAA